jgi:diguanylate cyclase (GGDEF)-like protein
MGISNVVPSAARGLPIAAVAIPYRAHGQRRVFSGAFEVSRTPLSAYMRSVSLGKNHRVFIIDAEGSIVAGSRPGSSGPMSLTDASLAGVTARPGDQRMETSDGQLVVVTGVANTPWRVVMAVPSRSLFEPVDGANRWLPWLVLLGIAILGFICVAMGSVMMARRRALDEVNAELERVSRTDDMTNLTNRRGIEETVGPSFAAAVRGNRPFSILMLDIDLLRSVNDSFGRRSGDQILIQASKRIATEMRASDMLGRWGGEEFIVVLIDTDLYAANESAERLRELIGSQPFDTDAGMIEVSVSIGVATRDQDTFSSLVERAEDALLRAKRAGRDLVLTA